MSTTARLGVTLALATVLMVLAALSSATASGKWRTTYFCTNVKPKVVREITGKTATSRWPPRLCVKTRLRAEGKVVTDPFPVEGDQGPIIIPDAPTVDLGH